MHFTRELGRGLPKGTPAYVFVHGMTCIFKKKKGLSATLGKVLNPRKAFKSAVIELQKFKNSGSLGSESVRRLTPAVLKNLSKLSVPEAHQFIYDELTRNGYSDIYTRTFFEEYHPLHELGKGVKAEIVALLPHGMNNARFIITARDVLNQSVLIL